MSRSRLRVAVRFFVLFSLLLALSLTQSWATPLTNQGSSATTLPNLDTAVGQVYIYNGGLFPSGETVNTFNWFGPVFAGFRDMTPLLFSVSGGIFTVVGIGTPDSVSGTGLAQSVAFGLLAGSNVTGGNWTFGFVNGLANTDGTFSATSAGTVAQNFTVVGGTGVGLDSTTNDWVFTPSDAGINVKVGTTFGIPGSGAANFTLNNPALGAFNTDRTYSANADGALSGVVAEPGTFSLITGAGLVLAGLFRYRYSRGRRTS
jgi:hypothetical protein